MQRKKGSEKDKSQKKKTKSKGEKKRSRVQSPVSPTFVSQRKGNPVLAASSPSDASTTPRSPWVFPSAEGSTIHRETIP